MRIPFLFIPINKAKKSAKKFYNLVDPIAKRSDSLKIELEQTGFDLDEREYLGIAFLASLYMFSIIFVPIFLVGVIFAGFLKAFVIALILAGILFFVTFLYIKKYPKLLLKKKISDLEKNLPYVLRHLYIQIRSGVTIFDALVSVSSGNYGYASKEFGDIVKDINRGISIESAIDRAVLRTPSQYFRRVIWQISNELKGGGDLGEILNNIIINISAEQRIAIRKYGSLLNTFSLMYMMLAVVLPSLGVTFLIVLSIFSGISISETMFWLILLFLFVFQFMFLGMVKSRRPTIV